MNWSDFKTEVSGKWVLTGEHSVLRGATAIAVPYQSVGLSLCFEFKTNSNLNVMPQSAQGLVQELFDSVADAWEEEGNTFVYPTGQLEIKSTIPIGAGLGSSAALCVALTRWMAEPLGLQEKDWVEFATRLEHRFHGRSSGMDVAAISYGEPISYVMGEGVNLIGIKKLPFFTLHDTNLRTRTSDCVLRVEQFREESAALAIRVDEEMSVASRWALEGLIRYDAGSCQEGLDLLQKAMKRAHQCFDTWQLVPEPAERLKEQLIEEGALAVKLTGAGGGGMLVALWPSHSLKSFEPSLTSGLRRPI